MELLTGVGCSPELCEFLIEQGRHSRPADLREKSVLEELEKLEKLEPGKLAMAKPLLVSTSYLLLFSTPMVWLLIGPTAAHKIAAGYFVIPLAITLYFWWTNFRNLREGLQDERDWRIAEPGSSAVGLLQPTRDYLEDEDELEVRG